MAPNLAPGTFKIVSLIDGNPPVGVNHTKPADQKVHVNAPVTAWVIKKASKNTYHLGVGGYAYTGVMDNDVIASIHPKQSLQWIATYRERQDAYTIAPDNDEVKGWTVPDDQTNPAIVLRLIIAGKSHPPTFSTGQLFRFVPTDNLDE